MFRLRNTALLSFGLLLAGCMAHDVAMGGGGANTINASMAGRSAAAAPEAAQEEYRITPLDELDVTVFELPQLTRAVQVGATGQISLPLIGAVQASGKTARQLEADVTTALRKKYLQNPQVSVEVKKSASQRVTVEGSVKKPGVFPIVGTTTLMQVIAQSEGLDPLADPQGIVIFRNTPKGRTAAKFDVNAIRAGRSPDPIVRAGDLIVVDESGVRATWKALRETLPAFAIFAAFL